MMSTATLSTHRWIIATLFLVVVLAGPAGAQDFGYSVTVDMGAAAAAGGDLSATLAEFGDSVGAYADDDGTGALYAPVLGAAVGFGIDMELSGPLRGSAGLELRRLGYAFWAPEISASSWLALWAAGIRLGLRYEPGAWRLGAGASVMTPASGIRQAASQGGAGITVAYDVDRVLILGGYLEAGLALATGMAFGPFVAVPVAGFMVGLWPTGIVGSVRAWQAQAGLVVTLDLKKRTAR